MSVLYEDGYYGSIPEGGVTKLFAAHVFLRDSGAIKSVGIESMDLGLSKKSNESF